MSDAPDVTTRRWRRVIKRIRRQGPGNCYEAACTLFANAKVLGLDEPRIISATVMGQGPMSGVRFVHWWVEADGHAFDFSGRNAAVLPVNRYRALAEAEDVVEHP